MFWNAKKFKYIGSQWMRLRWKLMAYQILYWSVYSAGQKYGINFETSDTSRK